MTPAHAALEAHDLGKTWRRGRGRHVTLFEGVQLRVAPGQSLAIMGASGSGKSSLLHLLAGIDRHHLGVVAWAGTELSGLSDAALSKKRCRNVGLAMQHGALVATLPVRDNVTLPAWLLGDVVDTARANTLMRALNVGHLADSMPQELSGGEAARVALARALYPRPPILLCDEPTGALDADSAALALSVLSCAVADGAALVTATHDPYVAQSMHQVLQLSHGKLVTEATS